MPTNTNSLLLGAVIVREAIVMVALVYVLISQ